MNTHLTLFINKEHYIVDIQGNVEEALGVNKSFIHKNMNLFEIPWNEVTINAPKLSEEFQTIKMLTGDFLLFYIIDIPNTVSKNHYAIVINKLTEQQLESSSSPFHNETFEELPNRSSQMQKIINIVKTISQVDSTVLLLGETGVGKTWFAKYIHDGSSRKKAPFVSINCGTLPASLIESELFGYEAGTFTGGKVKGKKGLFEIADGGIVFLDEIAELPFSVQSKLLEVLQEHSFRKIGGAKNINVDIRIIAATNADLQQLVREKKFREDLYYRLNVVPLTIPPLRNRPEEIVPLAKQFIDLYNKKYNQNMILSLKIKEELLTHHWPGNIRELENNIERMVVTKSETLFDDQKPDSTNASLDIHNVFTPLKEAKKEFEKRLILDAYQKFGTTYRVADILKVDQSTIAKKIKQYRDEGDSNDDKY